MMVHLISPAEDEFAQAAEYYENQRQGLGDEFIDEILRAANILSDFPQIGPMIESPYRVFVVRRFPYSLVYREAQEEIIIVAVAHHSRRPGYWKSRIS